MLPLNSENRELSRIHVVAGVIRDADGRVLLAQRPAGKQLAGMWEFPGGKVEPDEDADQALGRELEEELGIRSRIGRPLIVVPHGRIVLDVREVVTFEGDLRSREGQCLSWVDPAQIDVESMPIADRPVVTALRLPDLYQITPELGNEDKSLFLERCEQVLVRGIRLIQLRMPGWSRERVAPLARQLRQLCHAYGAQLLLHADWALAEVLGLDGVHLPSRVAQQLSQRPLPRGRWVAVSCHDADELAHAAEIGADFATLSPVSTTASHPQAMALGWDRTRELINEARLPVYALGGLGMSDVDITHAREHGAQGIAAIKAGWFA